ncbi:helix-turn-helix domain-containing protein [Actinokineospora pegani]|uniref:helix-turn-helix domain-containing protein n=1 Tax=Actinokineospora pegani TaxID=2654637 RepID=UPI001F187C62|nr:helix-turn-helix domain-containing protein [Actinokineospora pegani]
MEEGRKLQRVTRTAKYPVRLRRAAVVLMSGQGQAVRDITSLMQVSEDCVRDVIHAFNERGFAALDPEWSGGRSRTIGEAIRERICLIARTSPADWGITAFSTWSLARLREHLLDRGTVATVSRETLRRVLRDASVSWQATTTWKASTDPDFLAKMHRILDLYDHPPHNGRVICLDEFGPLNLVPRKAKAWRPAAPITGHLQPSARRDAHARRAGPGHREDPLPDPPPQTAPRVPRPAQSPPRPLARSKALPGHGQLLPASTRNWAADNDAELG